MIEFILDLFAMFLHMLLNIKILILLGLDFFIYTKSFYDIKQGDE